MIENISSEFDGVNNRVGDYGKDEDGIYYCYTSKGWWKCMNEAAKDLVKWKKKYEELLKSKLAEDGKTNSSNIPTK